MTKLFSALATFFILSGCQTLESLAPSVQTLSDQSLCVRNETEVFRSASRKAEFVNEFSKRRLNCNKYSQQIFIAKQNQQAGFNKMIEGAKPTVISQGGIISGGSRPNPPKITRYGGPKEGYGEIRQPISGNKREFSLINSSLSPGKNLKICLYQELGSGDQKETFISPLYSCDPSIN